MLTLSTLKELYVPQNPPGPLLGVDLGKKTIGLAKTDSKWGYAVPLETVQRTRFKADVKHLAAHMDNGFSAMVVGLPLHVDGRVGPRAQAAQDFVRLVNMMHPTWNIMLWDERFSTQQARDKLFETGKKQKHHKATIDALAASVILEDLILALKNA